MKLHVLLCKLFNSKSDLNLCNFSVQATVGFTLFGKETLADLDLKEIVAETN